MERKGSPSWVDRVLLLFSPSAYTCTRYPSMVIWWFWRALSHKYLLANLSRLFSPFHNMQNVDMEKYPDSAVGFLAYLATPRPYTVGDPFPSRGSQADFVNPRAQVVSEHLSQQA